MGGNGFILRQYQKKVARQIQSKWKSGHRSVLLVMPPNAGKTVVFLHIIKAALKKGQRVCVVAPNIVLTQQTIDKLEHMNPGIIWSNRKADYAAQLQVASAHTLANRLVLYQFDLLVIDEAHHCAADTWMKITEHYPEANILGVTATAKRMDGKGLDVCGFTDVVHGPWIDALTPEFMSPMRLWAPNVPALLDAPDGVDYKSADLEKHGIKMGVLIGDAVKHYSEHCKGKRALAFCMSIADSKDTVNKFKKAGYRAEHMDGNTPHEERQQMLADLNAKRIDLISSCNVLSEGLDIPGIDVVIQLRSTRSYQVYVQQIGRGLRQDESNPGKRLEVIDCAGNFYRLWHPAIDRKYGLDGVAQVDKETGERDATRKRCPSCSLVDYPGDDGKCQGCGREYPASNGAKARHVWRDGELVTVGGGWKVFPKPSHDGKYVIRWGRNNFERLNIGVVKDETLARKRFEKFISNVNVNGRLPKTKEEAKDWAQIDYFLGMKPLSFPDSCGRIFTFSDGNIQIYLGSVSEKELAMRRFERYVKNRQFHSRYPSSKQEAKIWTRGKHPHLREISFPKPSGKGLYRFSDGVCPQLGPSESIARLRFERYMQARDLFGRKPADLEEAYAWMGKYDEVEKIKPIEFPKRSSSRGNFVIHVSKPNRVTVSLGTDEKEAAIFFENYINAREKNNREPFDLHEANLWSGRPLLKRLFFPKLSASGTYTFKAGDVTVYLGVQSGRDNAVIMFQNFMRHRHQKNRNPANKNEAREWLGLPPKKRKD